MEKSTHSHTSQVDDFTNRLFFNKYKPVKKLGEGSFGKIYSAVNVNTHQKFALKMVTLKKYNIFILGIKRRQSKFIRIRSLYIMLFKRL